MARDISELGADVYDDSPKQVHKISPKKRNYIIGLSIGSVLLAAAITGSVIACNTILLDYSNLDNVTYYYTPQNLLKDGEKPTAILYKLKSDVKYPSSFRIPSQVKGYKVVGVADNAFVGHNEIKKVIMPNTLEYVGERAFYNCTSLASFSWSKNLTDVGVDAFLNTAFYSNLLKDDKAMYDLPSGLLIYVGKNYFEPNTALVNGDATEEQINNIKTKYGATSIKKFSDLKVKNICSGSFKNNDKICYIDLPQEVDEIANATFENCSNLKGIDGTHAKLTQINKRAFANCEKLKDIILPNNLTVLGDEAFYNTGLVDSIPNVSNVEKIGEYVFANCKSLTSVTYYGKTVTNYMFSGCSSLETIYWGDGNANIDEITSIGYGAFSGTKFSSFVVPKNVEVISDASFKDCKSLEKVSLWANPTYMLREIDEDELDVDDEGEPIYPTYIDYDGNVKNGKLRGVESIKASAFSGCTSLTTFDLYDDNYAYWRGDAEEFTFPASLLITDASSTSTSSNSTFKETAVSKLNINPNQKNIGSYAFSNSTSLKEVEVMDIDKSRLTNIKKNAFEDCTSLKTFILPSSLTTLGASVFKGCTALEEVGLENTKIGSISAELFNGCESLKTAVLPSTVGNIKTDAFHKNYKLNYVIIPSSVNEVQEDSFTEARETAGDKLAIYFLINEEQTKQVNFAGNTPVDVTSGDVVIKRQLWHDDTVEAFFLYEPGTPVNKDFRYWNGDVDNPAEIFPD